MQWQELVERQPRLAATAHSRLIEPGVVLVATLRRDGSPRLSPVEPFVLEGDLLLSMLWQSFKARDLLRDPRVYVHAPVTAKEGSPEFKLAGRATVLEDKALRGKLDDLFWEMIEWRPAPDSHYFEFLAERAAWVTYDEGQTSIRWRLGAEGEKRLYKPGI